MDCKKIDTIMVFFLFFLLAFIKAESLLLGTFMFIPIYIYFTKRSDLYLPFIISIILSMLWNTFAKSLYNYKNGFIAIAGYNAFPLLGWTLGLFSTYLLYSHLEDKTRNFMQRFTLFTILYWLLLIFAETIAYHMFSIQLTSNYPGLPLCDCMHAPLWSQIGYFLNGPIFFLLLHISRLNQTKKP